MASANEAGELRVVAETPTGFQHVVWSGRSDGPINAGKSPDGVLANLTRDKWVYWGLMGPTMSGGWKVRLLFKMDSSDGIDASDCVIQIPVTFDDGSKKILNASDLGFTTDLPASSPSGQWIELGTGYTIPNGARAKIGGDYVVISIEDDTA